jgi:hypothetical protein
VINTEVENSCEASQRVAVWIKLMRLQTAEPEGAPKGRIASKMRGHR